MNQENAALIAAATVFLCLLNGADSQLTWEFAGDEAALCNDFTRAGFFHRNVSGEEKKWVIFLESGSLCYSSDTCNRRYFQSHVRERYSSDGRGPFGTFDTSVAWANTGGAGRPLAEVVNPLMTSLYCFRNETKYFGSTETFAIEGRDVLSSDCTENPTFCNHGHVLVPYCSSDVWLGQENATSRQYKREPCDCWDRECFEYNPTSEDLQFTFRGRTIFQSIIKRVDKLYNLREAEEIVLMGSSAGGVGVLNLAKWVRQEYGNVSVKVVSDSSWFISFRDSINQQFDSLIYNISVTNSRVLGSQEACSDTRLGYPCCLSAQCLLTKSSPTTGEPYFPHDVPLFILTSLYDIFLLADSLVGLALLQSDKYSTAGLALQFITTIGEYGGAMNASLIETASEVRSNLSFSYYVTQCFQHIYFATSTLRGSQALLDSEPVIIGPRVATFRHTVQSGVWADHTYAFHNDQGITIRDALNYWYQNASLSKGGMGFRDLCSGPRCNDGCPEELILQDPEADVWSAGVRIMIATIVIASAVISVLLKIYCWMWLRCLHWEQKCFLDGVNSQTSGAIPEVTGKSMRSVIEFPYCTDDKAISVACLDLHYYVNVDIRTQTKDEKKDTYSPLTLSGLRPEDELNAISPTENDGGNSDKGLQKIFRSCLTKKKKILNGISAYFNPLELIAIMGPSGCGKTTFLDLLTGRRKTGNLFGDIFVNGIPIQENRNWYISNTGYVLQLAAPYYEELTVRENLTLAAWVKLHVSTREKFERVEQVMAVTGLLDLADTVVGGATGPGLSGGQKRRLVVALQLLKLPTVIFLDEPTSGLDAASSTELLTHLNTLAASNRTVVLTIHQPRLEIFHMFHRILVLSEGKVAYHGVPDKAYEVFVSALHSCYLQQSLVIPDLEHHNPADVIMDMLGNRTMRRVVTKYYEESGEPKLISKAVVKAWNRERFYSDNAIDSAGALPSQLGRVKLILKGSRHAGRTHNYSIVRLAALEARAMKRATLGIMLYLPTIFFSYGVLLGTVYFQQTTPFLIMSGFCVYSVASALFMFPALYGYLSRALEIYTFERADGAGRASDLVIQPFVRFISIAFIPVVVCAGVLYLLMVERLRWDFLVFVQVVVVNVALNHVWTALLIWLILTFPQKAIRLSPVISALAGFTSGFFIPINQIPWWYRWLCYINPNFYGFSASAVLLLSNFESDCERNGGSELECYTSSGQYVLDSFYFNDINPYQNIVILMSMTLLCLMMAAFSNWFKFLVLQQFLTRIRLVIQKTLVSTSYLTAEPVFYHSLGEKCKDSDDESSDEDTQRRQHEEAIAKAENTSFLEDQSNELELVPLQSPAFEEAAPYPRQTGRNKKSKKTQDRNSVRHSLYLEEGKEHAVWKPNKQSSSFELHDVAKEVRKQLHDLHERQHKLLSRVQATREVMKVQMEEIAMMQEADEQSNEEEENEKVGEEDEVCHKEEQSAQGSDSVYVSALTDKEKWQYAIKRVIKCNTGQSGKRKQRHLKHLSLIFHDAVSQHTAAMSQFSSYSELMMQGQETVPSPLQAGAIPLGQWKGQPTARPSKAGEGHQVQEAEDDRFSTELGRADNLYTISEEDIEGTSLASQPMNSNA